MSIDLEQFHQIFFEESFEGLDIMESGLLNLNLGAADVEEVNTIFRAAHSIKGGSGTFGFKDVSDFTHVMETILDEMRDGRREVTREGVDLLLESVDCLREMLTATKAGDPVDTQRVGELHNRLEQQLGKQKGEAVATGADSSTEDSNAGATGWSIGFRPHEHLFQTGNDPYRLIRELDAMGQLEVTLDTSRLPVFTDLDPEQCHLGWQLSLQGEVSRESLDEVFEWVVDDADIEISPLKSDAQKDAGLQEHAAVQHPQNTQTDVAPDKRVAERRQGERRKKAAGKDSGSIRVNIDKIDSLINMVGELVITQSMLSQVGGDMDVAISEKMRDGLDQLERNTRELQENVMRIRMLPISFSFNRFPRLVHDLSGKLGKKVELKLSGEQTELDKTVLEKIADPLVHLVRNALDHGIENPEVRRAAGKPETGVVHLNAYHQGGNVVIEITDDGAGINKEKLLEKSRQKGLIGPDEALPDERIYDLLFAPGVSTAEKLSDVSGRGVGMDVVKRNIKDLGGNVEVKSTLGEGSTFTVRLPLTLAILDGQLVRVGQETYIIPLVSIIESLQIKPQKVSSISGRAELYKLRDEYIPIVRLYDVFNIGADSQNLDDGLLVVVDGDGQKAGLFIDDLLAQQQVVIKSLETNYQSVKGVSGATILGDGTVALILDIVGVIECANKECDEQDGAVKAVA